MSGTYRILLVDDEPDLLETVKMALSRCLFSLSIEACHDGREALEKFKQAPDGYSLVLTDIRMPHISGFELGREILKIRPQIPILYMTAYVIDEKMPGFPPAMQKAHIISKPGDILKLCGIFERELSVVVK